MPTSAAFSVSGIIIDADGRPLRTPRSLRSRRASVADSASLGSWRPVTTGATASTCRHSRMTCGSRSPSKSPAAGARSVAARRWSRIQSAPRSICRCAWTASRTRRPPRSARERERAEQAAREAVAEAERADRERAAAEAAERERRERERDQELNLRVSGVVRDRFGDLMPGVTVDVYDCDLRNREFLGTTQTWRMPRPMSLRTAGSSSPAPRRHPPTWSCGWSARTARPWGSRRWCPNAPPSATIDIDLSGAAWAGESQWDHLSGVLMPLLGEVAPADLREDGTDDDITFLAAETGLAPLAIGTWSASFRMSRRPPRSKPTSHRRRSMRSSRRVNPRCTATTRSPTSRTPTASSSSKTACSTAPAAADLQRHRELLEAAVAQNLVPARVTRNSRRSWRAWPHCASPAWAARTSAAAKARSPTSCGRRNWTDADSTVVLDTLALHNGPLRDLWTDLEKKNLPTDTVRRVKLTFDLGSLTRNHVPLLTALSQQITRGEIGAKRDLAKLSTAEWADMLSAQQPDGTVIGARRTWTATPRTRRSRCSPRSSPTSSSVPTQPPPTPRRSRGPRLRSPRRRWRRPSSTPTPLSSSTGCGWTTTSRRTRGAGRHRRPGRDGRAVKTVQRVFKLNPTVHSRRRAAGRGIDVRPADLLHGLRASSCRHRGVGGQPRSRRNASTARRRPRTRSR